MTVQEMLALKQELKPAQGFAVIGVDTFGDPDEQGPFSCGEFGTVEEAQAELAQRRAESPDEKYFIYSADGSIVE